MGIALSPLFSSGMVLQRNKPISIQGTGDVPVTLTFLGRQYHALPGNDGAWSVPLPPLAPGGPFEMRINDICLQDVYVGDVWLCAGQSNMQLPMQRVKHMYPEEMEAKNPAIRQFIVPQRTDFHGPQATLEGGKWEGVTPETVAAFSAVGYFFAKRLQARYGVPIGLLLTAIGGTPVHAWMGRDILQAYPSLLAEADKCADDGYVAAVQAEDAARSKAFFEAIDRTDPGLIEGWHTPEYGDSHWEERPLTAPWAGTGSAWLRKTVILPDRLAGKPATLFLGTITDWDMVYVNGQPVGNTTYRWPPREYVIPSLPSGQVVIAIRVITKDGGGMVSGKQYLLSTAEGAIDISGQWRFRRGGSALPPPPETTFLYKPCGLYNGMIAPLKEYPVKGALWYQGESDTGAPKDYAKKYRAMVDAWRKHWGDDFPFLSVELAHWSGGPEWDALRQEQRQALSIPHTAMAAAYDLGEHNDLHPLNKQAVGDRLARCAMRLAYGETLPPSPFEIVPLSWEK